MVIRWRSGAEGGVLLLAAQENWQKLDLLLYLCAFTDTFSFLQAFLFFFYLIFFFLLRVPYWQLEQQKSARSDQGFNQFHQGFTASSSVRWIPSSVELSWPFHHPRWDYFGLLPLWQPRKVYIILTFHNFSKCGLEQGPHCARATHLCAFFGAKGSLLVWRETLGVKIYFWCEGTLFGMRQYSFGVRCIQWEGITFGVRE